MIKKYIKIWFSLTTKSTQIAFTSRFGIFIFLFGKFLRIGFFILFLLLLTSKINRIGGYSIWQVLLFYSTFNLVDAIPQFFFREVYRFREYVVSGSFDYILLKPISPLFRCLLGGSDILDLSIIVFALLLIVVAILHITIPSFFSVLLYLFLVFNAFCIALAFHVLVLVMGILTTEVENAIFLYRDLTQMGRVPIDIYTEPIRSVLTFVIPIGIMMTFPVKAMLGLLSISGILVATFVGLTFVGLSIMLWNYALRFYASAGS